ncbi:hypothetical protein HK100_009888, partial [Physocladia obscura]
MYTELGDSARIETVAGGGAGDDDSSADIDSSDSISGIETTIEFRTRGVFSDKGLNVIDADVKSSADGSVLAKLSGRWSDQLYIDRCAPSNDHRHHASASSSPAVSTANEAAKRDTKQRVGKINSNSSSSSNIMFGIIQSRNSSPARTRSAASSRSNSPTKPTPNVSSPSTAATGFMGRLFNQASSAMLSIPSVLPFTIPTADAFSIPAVPQHQEQQQQQQQQRTDHHSASPSSSCSSSSLGPELLFDAATMPVLAKTVAAESEMESFESRRLWRKVTAAIHGKDLAAATEEKTAIEDNQRRICRERDEAGIVWK